LAIATIKQEIHHDNIDPEDILKKSHAVVKQEAEKNHKTMATTIVLCRIDENTGDTTIAHVGDSRGYIMQNEMWRTKDHTLVQELVNLGILSPDDACNHPERHRISQALGIKDDIAIDHYTTTLTDGVILLSSDGLHNYLTDQEIQTIATRHPPDQACNLLVNKAQKNGSTDDITVILIRLDEMEEEKPKKTKAKTFTFV
ncbi:MAG TPA: SpoIIE family protein phosphatase, partial [Candidatus Thermoplasmatota archaeon]|nr:SpoIIE family protein phosphatase [Candidatus Thermoplasmatota archaeon]